MHYVHKKARCEPEIATFRTKTLHFLRVIRLNWLAKIELRGTRHPWSSKFNIVDQLYCCQRKMLKRNWNWRNNRLFCHIFVFGEISIRGGPCPQEEGALPPSPCLCLCSKWGKQKRCSQIFREVSGVFQRNFNCSKIVLSSSRGHGNFRRLEASRPRTCGFEAKALARTSSRTPPLPVQNTFNACVLV